MSWSSSLWMKALVLMRSDLSKIWKYGEVFPALIQLLWWKTQLHNLSSKFTQVFQLLLPVCVASEPRPQAVLWSYQRWVKCPAGTACVLCWQGQNSGHREELLVYVCFLCIRALYCSTEWLTGGLGFCQVMGTNVSGANPSLWMLQNYLQVLLCPVISIIAICFCVVLPALTPPGFSMFRINWPTWWQSLLHYPQCPTALFSSVVAS